MFAELLFTLAFLCYSYTDKLVWECFPGVTVVCYTMMLYLLLHCSPVYFILMYFVKMADGTQRILFGK